MASTDDEQDSRGPTPSKKRARDFDGTLDPSRTQTRSRLPISSANRGGKHNNVKQSKARKQLREQRPTRHADGSVGDPLEFLNTDRKKAQMYRKASVRVGKRFQADVPEWVEGTERQADSQRESPVLVPVQLSQLHGYDADDDGGNESDDSDDSDGDEFEYSDAMYTACYGPPVVLVPLLEQGWPPLVLKRSARTPGASP
jgi:hypothetical protein